MIVKLVARSALAIVPLLLFVLAHTAQADTHQTVPSANFSFMGDLQNFLRVEDANRYGDLFPSVVTSGGIHTVGAGLTHAPDALAAYPAGFYTTETGSIVYPDNSVCWVIAHKDTIGNLGSFTRVAGTHYLINCGSTPRPSLPASAVWLMRVTTSGGSVSAVVDHRPLSTRSIDLCRYDSLDAAIAAVGSTPTIGIVSCRLPVQSDQTGASTMTLVVSPGGLIDLELSNTDLIINGPFWAPPVTIFTGAGMGNVRFAGTNVASYWWGPVGDGVADDTAELQAAVSAAANGTLLIYPANTSYKLTTNLTLSSNTHIIGIGRPLLLQSSANAFIFTAASKSNITIEHLRLQCGGTSATFAETEGCMNFSLLTDTRIYDNEISQARNGIACMICTNLWIVRNNVHDFGFAGIVVGKSVNFHVDYNIIKDSAITGAASAYGVHATGNQAGGFTQERNTINYNHISGIPSWDGVMSHDADGLAIIGNDIRDVRNGIDIGHLASSNVIVRIVISNNTIVSTATDTWSAANATCSGISIVGYDATHRVEDFVVTDNIIDGFAGFTQATTAGGVWLVNALNGTVGNNTIHRTKTVGGGGGTAGILFNGQVDSITVTSNTITDAPSNSSLYGINFYDASGDSITLSHNNIHNEDAGIIYAMATNIGGTLTRLGVGINPTNIDLNNYFARGSSTTVTFAPGSVMVGTATKNFSAPGAVPGVSDTTLSVSGADVGDKCLVTAPVTYGAAFLLDGFSHTKDFCTIRWVQLSGAAADPDGSGGTYSVKVIK